LKSFFLFVAFISAVCIIIVLGNFV